MAGLVRFSETLRGYVDAANVDDSHERHAASGRARPGKSHELVFMLTVVTDDIDAMIADPRHRSPVFGCVLAPVLSPRPLRVERGTLDLFADVGHDGDGAEAGADVGGRVLHMRYVLPLVDDHAGRRFVLRGIKEVVRRRPWPTIAADTTTLFVDIWSRDGDDDAAPPVWRGVLREGLVGVAQQAISFRGDPGGLLRFLTFYVRAVVGVVFGRRRDPPRRAWARVARFVEAPLIER
jgi:cholesterol oxidase